MGKRLSEYRNEKEIVDRALAYFAREREMAMPTLQRTTLIGLNTPIPPVPLNRLRPSDPNSPKQRKKRKLFESQKGLCAYCDDPVKIEEATLDHIKARSKGGQLNRSNTAMVCHACNSLKGDISSVAEANERIFLFAEFIARIAQRGFLK